MKSNRFALVVLSILICTIFSLNSVALSAESSSITPLQREEKMFTDEEYRQFYSSVRYPTQSELLSRSTTIKQTTILTSDGTPVTAYTFEEMSSEEQADLTNEINEEYPELEQIAPPSDLYNCHSYAWYKRSHENNEYWINSIDEFINDAHTIEIPESQAAVGDIVAYIFIDGYVHSAVIDEIKSDGTIVCRSKWGRYGLYRHDIDYVHSTYTDQGEVNYDIFRYTQDEHDLTVFPTSSTHIYQCELCDYVSGEQHEFTYSSSSSTNHTATCTICNYSYTESHSLEYIDQSSTTHSAYCSICLYSRNEPHTSNAQGTQCVYCLRTDDFIGVINQNKNEESE